MNCIKFILSTLTACLLLSVSALAATTEKPNILVLLADDLGYTDLACYGSRYYETPNIDRLAGQSIRFSDGYSCGPNCLPTRAALMSGQYGARTGVYTVGSSDRFGWESRTLKPVNNSRSLPAHSITIAQTLKQAGYATGIVGKWHLGRHPLDCGFDEFFGFLRGGHPYLEGSEILPGRTEGNELLRGRTPVNEPTYLTDALGREAMAFIRQHQERPFFVYLSFNAVHIPLESRPDKSRPFQAKPSVGGHKNPVYAGMLASLDENVGRVLALLDELQLSDKTLVIFSSDNGGVGGYARENIDAQDITDNAPLRGGKGMLYEGGIRVPYLFRWPAKIKPGATCGQPINSVDLYPTLLEVAGAKPPADYPLDGKSYLDLLTGQSTTPRGPLYWHFPGYLGAGGNTWRTLPVGVIRSGDWKLLEFFEDGRLELYHLKDDVGERHNLAAVQPEKTIELHEKLIAWRQSVQAPMPTKNTAN